MKPRTKSVLAKLTARAARGQQHVEVEHLLLLVKLGDPSAAPVLRELAAKHDWPMRKRGFVPLGAWAEAIAVFLEDGPMALAREVKKKRLDGDVVLGLLEEVVDAKSIEACIAIAADPKLTRVALDAVGMIASSKKVVIDGGLAKKARTVAERFLRRGKSDVDRSAAYCALARVGDQRSLDIMTAMPKESSRSAFADYRDDAIAALRRRLAKA